MSVVQLQVPRGTGMKGEEVESELEYPLELKRFHWLPVILNPLQIKQFLVAWISLARKMLVRVRTHKSPTASITKVLQAFSTCHMAERINHKPIRTRDERNDIRDYTLQTFPCALHIQGRPS